MLSGRGVAQAPLVYTVSATDTAFLSSQLAAITVKYKAETDTLTGNNKQHIADVYKDRFNSLKEMFDNKEIAALPDAQAYLQQLSAQILKANPCLNTLPTSFLFSKTAVPNAAAWGEGVIVFNIGLFTKLQTEGQAIFVLCHELAHLYLNHSNNSINRYVATMYSAQTQDELKKIQKSAFNKRKQIESLVKNIAFDNRRHGRDHETEADSLAVVFMKNTPYSVNDAFGCLAVLDSVDYDGFKASNFMQHFFNCKEYPFKDKWLEKEEGLLGGYAKPESDKTLEDSLKTHPDCTARITALKKITAGFDTAAKKKFVVSEDKFRQLQSLFPYEETKYYYDAKLYSRCLYEALKILDKDTANAFAITITGQVLNDIYATAKAHTLHKYVDVPAAGYTDGYNTVLQLLQNAYTDEIAGLNYYFLKKNRQKLTTYPMFEAAFLQAAKNMSQ